MSLFCTEPTAKENALTEGERNKLVESVVPWCKKLARDMAKSISMDGLACDVEDLESEAYVAATGAARHYQPERGLAFITMATSWIRKHFLSVIDVRRQVLASNMERPELVSEQDNMNDVDTYEPNADERRLLNKLKENPHLPSDAEAIVRRVVFEGRTPDQVAVEFGRDVKDVKLIIRNSADVLCEYQKREMDREKNGLFGQQLACDYD